jgi:hypothetical protein
MQYKIKPYKQKWKENDDRLTKDRFIYNQFIINTAYEHITFVGSKKTAIQTNPMEYHAS